MIKILKIADNEKVIKEISHLNNFFLDMFGEGQIGVLAVLDENELGFVGLKEGKACYVKNVNDKLNFLVFGFENDFSLSYIVSDDIPYVFTEDSVCSSEKNGLIKELKCVKLSNPDQDSYNARIIYLQMNSEANTNLELHYQSDYYYNNPYGTPYIYRERLKNFKFVYLVDYKKMGIYSLPGIGKKYNFYVGYEMEKDSRGFRLFNEDNDNNVIRYLRMTHLINNTYTDSILSGFGISKKEMCSLISSYGFDTEVPEKLLKMYNYEDEEYLLASNLVTEIGNVMKNKEEDKQARLILTKE